MFDITLYLILSKILLPLKVNNLKRIYLEKRVRKNKMAQAYWLLKDFLNLINLQNVYYCYYKINIVSKKLKEWVVK